VVYAIRLRDERNATLAEVARVERLQQFLFGLFSGGEPEVGPARELTVHQLLERGVLTAEILTGDPEVHAELTKTLGTLFGDLGDFARAEELLKKSVAEQARIRPPHDERLLESQVALALLWADQSKLAEAEQMAKTALEHVQPSQPPTSSLVVRAGLAVGKVLVARGKYADAIAHLEVMVQSFDTRAPGTVEQAAVVSELATAHQYAGHLDDADRLNQRALTLDRRLHGDMHPSVADDLINLADADSTRGRYADAERRLREAVNIFERWYGPTHPETGSAMRILALSLSMQGNLEEAASLVRRARDIFAATYATPHRRLGLVLNDLGTIALRRGRWDEAIAAFTQALSVYRKVYPDGKSQYISVGLANLGSVYLDKHDYGNAERLLREAVTLSTEILSPEHTNTAIAEIKLGHALVRQRRLAEAVPVIEHGRAILSRHADPNISWLKTARTDLAEAYERIGRSADAQRLRSEAASSGQREPR
jgi:eukaryotic-like serine/threonine-protein kinase